MTLRTQLLLIAILVLVLPLSGWQFARQVERTLRAGHAEALETAARTVARQITQADVTWPEVNGGGLYLHDPDGELVLDGYADDWRALIGDFPESDAPTVQAAWHEDSLFLLFEVDSSDQRFSQPGRQNGDRLELEFQRDDGLKAAVELAPLAPGFIEARGPNAQAWPRVQGYWQSRARGWTVELRVSRPNRIRSLSWRIVDVLGTSQDASERVLSSEGLQTLVRTQHDLVEALYATLPEQTRAWVTLPSDWVIAYADRSASASNSSLSPSWVDTILFEGLASDSIAVGPTRNAGTTRIRGPSGPDQGPTSRWSSQSDRPGVRLTTTHPIVEAGQLRGHLVVERDADRLLLDSNRAVLRLLAISLGVSLIVALVLLAYATWLSERIRRLRNGLEASVGEDGRVQTSLRETKQRDEIGDLGRSVARLLTRLREHQTYLRTLADKLAHELRTPLAMVRSSLDNLEAVDDHQAVERYRRRALEGSERLNRIFQAMSQAARIEESLSQEAFEPLLLTDFVNHYLAACRDTYPRRRFRLIGGGSRFPVRAAPDLLAQLLDKLIDNAVDFSPDESTIRLRLRRSGQHIELDVENDGPALPDNSETLFSSMVSVRQRKGTDVHLGLGLSIVRLIAEHHGGSIEASNIGEGVRFRLRLPIGS